MKISNLIAFASILILAGCQEKEPSSTNENSIVYDYNVLIVPDLSNRINPDIHPKPFHDTILINNIADSIGSFLKIKNRQMNQLDIYKIDFINRGILNQNITDSHKLEINFRNLGDNLQKTSNYKREHLHTDIQSFKSNVSKIYDYSLQHLSGSDVWNYFNQTINSSLINDPDKKIKITEQESIIKGTRNIIVLLTDGYIESINNSSGYILDQNLIKKIRENFLQSNSSDLQKFITSNPEYLIKKTSHSLPNTSVLILEIVDRSLDKNGASTVQPTDFEIMKIIWTQWLIASGASKVSIQPVISKKTDASEIVKRFIQEIQ